MIDIETMSTTNNAAIVSLAAVQFDLNTGETGQELYCNVSLDSCLRAGLQVDADTIEWWMNKSDQARKILFNKTMNITSALNALSALVIRTNGDDTIVWGNSARFDLGILENAYHKCNAVKYWSFYNERCVRTLAALNPSIKKNTAFIGEAHNALDDCKHQINYCNETYKSLKVC